MIPFEELVALHLQLRDEAESHYRAAMDSTSETRAWAECLESARKEVEAALAATADLREIPAALLRSGRFARALRFLTGPPLSQDQFQLACPEWKKATEKSGCPLDEASALGFGATFRKWADRSRTESLEDPAVRERAVHGTALLIAQQEFATLRRMRLAGSQEDAAAAVLSELGYHRATVGFVDQPGVLGEREYARKCRFATADQSSHEVDLAIGLPRRRILAMECKVSNDRTNSVKRTNDVLKKAEAWRQQWGRLVITGALLEGVFSEKEPRRLVEAGVEVFWSHRLELFREWIEAEPWRLATPSGQESP
jgi:hypothetical protein